MKYKVGDQVIIKPEAKDIMTAQHDFHPMMKGHLGCIGKIIIVSETRYKISVDKNGDSWWWSEECVYNVADKIRTIGYIMNEKEALELLIKGIEEYHNGRSVDTTCHYLLPSINNNCANCPLQDTVCCMYILSNKKDKQKIIDYYNDKYDPEKHLRELLEIL